MVTSTLNYPISSSPFLLGGDNPFVSLPQSSNDYALRFYSKFKPSFIALINLRIKLNINHYKSCEKIYVFMCISEKNQHHFCFLMNNDFFCVSMMRMQTEH